MGDRVKLQTILIKHPLGSATPENMVEGNPY